MSRGGTSQTQMEWELEGLIGVIKATEGRDEGWVGENLRRPSRHIVEGLE